jgi:hypothetical protein
VHVGQNNDKKVHALHVAAANFGLHALHLAAANFGHRGEKSVQITSQQTPTLLNKLISCTCRDLTNDLPTCTLRTYFSHSDSC